MSRRSRRVSAPSDPTEVGQPLEGRLVGYRLVRRIASGDRADVYLAAVEEAGPGAPRGLPAAAAPGEMEVPVLVVMRVYDPDASEDSIACEIDAMSTDASGTLPALHDVASLDDGRCCLVVERIGGPRLARLVSDRTLSAGESVTLLAPVVVAVAELAERGFVHTRLAASDILLDEVGRPRLVGLGSLRRLPARGAERNAMLRSAYERLAELVDDVAASVVPRDTLRGPAELIRARLAARPFVPCHTDLERALFASAAPEPVRGIDVPMRPRQLPTRATAPVDDEHSDAVGDGWIEPPSTRALGATLRRVLELVHAPGELVDQVADAADMDRVSGVQERLGEVMRRRGRSLTVGALVGGAALVLLLTLVPPATADDDREPLAAPTAPAAPSASAEADARFADEPGASAAVEPDGAEAAMSGADGDPVAGTPAEADDPVAAARLLLERRAECFEALDLDCLDSVVQPGSSIDTADRSAIVAARDGVDLPDTRFDPTTVELAAAMGAAVLVRAVPTAGSEPASLLMVRGEAGWRLREVFD